MRSEARSPLGSRVPITVSIMLATIMQGIDNTIANVALPQSRAVYRRPKTRSPGF